MLQKPDLYGSPYGAGSQSCMCGTQLARQGGSKFVRRGPQVWELMSLQMLDLYGSMCGRGSQSCVR